MAETMNLTNEILKEVFTDALAVKGKLNASSVNLNELTKSGIYSVYAVSTSQGAPVNNMYGLLVHFVVDNVVQAQILIANYGMLVYVRLKWETWGAWRKVTLANLSS